MIQHKRSAGVIEAWAFCNHNALFWSWLVMPSGVFYLENTFMGVCYILKYGYVADLPERG